MLKIVKSLNELNIDQFLSVYEESIRENGQDFFRNETRERQIRMAEDSFLSYLREDFFRQKDAFYAVWTVDGVYKCALRMEPYCDGLLLQALETKPDCRGMGFAFDFVTAVLNYLRAENKMIVYSHIHKRNLPSLGLHRKCGFKQISDSAVYIDGTVTRNSCTMMIQL